jgi:SAM-dependent methyltransferase
MTATDPETVNQPNHADDPTDIEFWKRAWRRADASLGDAANFDLDKWRRVWKNLSRADAGRLDERVTRNRELIDFMVREGLVAEGSTTLDVGCGSGPFAIPLLERGVRVTALDPSEEMLETLRDAVESRGLPHPDYRAIPFEAIEPDNRYDFALAAYTPAVKDFDGVLALERVARGFCGIVSLADNQIFQLRDYLYREVLGMGRVSTGGNALFPFGALFASGRSPNVRFVEERIERARDLYETTATQQAYFAALGYNDDRTQTLIAERLADRAADGVILERFVKRSAFIYWRPSENR